MSLDGSDGERSLADSNRGFFKQDSIHAAAGVTDQPISLETFSGNLYKLKVKRINFDFNDMSKKRQTPAMLPFEAEEVLTSIGQAISLSRRARGWTQPDLAAKMGVSVNTVVNLEKGRPSVAFGQVLMALWTLDRLDVLRDAARVEFDPVLQKEALSRIPLRARAHG